MFWRKECLVFELNEKLDLIDEELQRAKTEIKQFGWQAGRIKTCSRCDAVIYVDRVTKMTYESNQLDSFNETVKILKLLKSLKFISQTLLETIGLP